MKGFEKGLPPSKSNAIRNLSSSGWVENNENDSSGDKLIPQFEKITFGKHFSSAAQRKKILAEIIEIPSVSDAQNHENCNLNLENSPQKMGISHDVLSCCGNAYEPKDDSSVVYDPLKNYLSPRPQFLRFNPNRRRDILKRLEKESIDELNSSFVSDEVEDGQESSAEEMGDSSLSPPKVCVANQRIEGIADEVNDDVIDADVDEVEEEEEEEDEEEERGWCFRGVLKLLLTLIACLLSSSYICSMNSPTNSPIQKAIWNLLDNGLVIKNGTHEFVSTRMHDDSFVQVEVGGNYRGIEEVQIYEENYGEIDESFGGEIVEYLEEWHEKEMIGYENEDSEDMVDEAAEYEGVGAAEFDFEVDKLQHLIDENAAENIDDGGMLLYQEVESSCAGSDEVNLSMDEAAEMEIIIGSGEVDSEPQSSGQLIGATTVVSEDARESELEMEIDSSIESQGTELSLKSISEEIPMESKGADDAGSLEELVGSHGELSNSMDEVDEIGDEVQVGREESEWNTSTIVGVSAAAFILTSLAIIYHSIKSRSISSDVSEPVQKQKFAVEANVNAVHQVPSIERKVEFLARASMREAPRELSNHIHAPTVELISEIVVGQASSIRSSGKYQMTISDNDYYATLSQKHDSLPELVPAPSQPSAIEPKPTSSSSSYGSFTTEKKISKKEGGQSRESMIGTTPVRRSSRLRNRTAVMSP